MAEAAQRDLQTPKRSKSRSDPKPSSPSLAPPPTPATVTPRRSARRASVRFDAASPPPTTALFQDPADKLHNDSVKVKLPRKRKSKSAAADDSKEHNSTPRKSTDDVTAPKSVGKGKKSKQKEEEEKLSGAEIEFSPASPEPSETKKRKRGHERNTVVTRGMASKSGAGSKKWQVFYKKVVYDGGEFEVGDDVYVKRREDDDEVIEVEECRVCFKSGKAVMIECDDCLGGFHLKCLKPPLKEVPEGDWICGFCEARKLGKEVQLPKPPEGKKLVRTFREKLLSSDLWAAHIER